MCVQDDEDDLRQPMPGFQVTAPLMPQPWECTRCHRINAPHMNQCTLSAGRPALVRQHHVQDRPGDRVMAWYWWLLIGGVGGAALVYISIVLAFSKMRW